MRIGYRRKYKIVLFLLPILFISLFLFSVFLKRAEPSFVAQTSNYSNTAFTDLVNKCIIDIANSDEFDDFFSVQSSDEISAMVTDTSKINLVTSKLVIKIQDALNADYPAKLYIPLGSLTNYYLLSSLGPSIPVKIIPISIVNSQLEEKFDSVGINHTRHSINLRIWVDMHYRGYLLDERERIETTVPICETILSGDVPEYYGTNMDILPR